MLKCPGDGQFERPARMKAGSARVPLHRRFRTGSRVEHGSPFALEEVELAQITASVLKQ